MQVTPSEVAARLQGGDSLFLLDVREPGEHEYVALPGSVLIPLGELTQRVDELSTQKDTEIIVYCHHCIRSANVTSFLRHHGFTRARNLQGGIDRWAIQVDPTIARY